MIKLGITLLAASTHHYGNSICINRALPKLLGTVHCTIFVEEFDPHSLEILQKKHGFLPKSFELRNNDVFQALDILLTALVVEVKRDATRVVGDICPGRDPDRSHHIAMDIQDGMLKVEREVS